MISFIIVTFNSLPEVLACLGSIEQCAARMPHEVILADNASSDGTVDTVRARFPSARVLANPDNAGFPKANNQALRLARGEYVFFLNPDAELVPGTLERLLAELEGHPERSAVGPRVRRPSEFITRTCARRLPTLWSELCDRLWWSRMYPRSRILAWKYYAPWDGATDRDVECLLGAAMLCRTEQVRELGGFDETVPLYLDDTDLCRRLGDIGRLRYVSDATLVHHYFASSNKQPPALILRVGLQASYVYFAKHRGRSYARAYAVLVACLGITCFVLGFLRLVGGSLVKARRRWDDARVFVDWAWRSKHVTYTLPRVAGPA